MPQKNKKEPRAPKTGKVKWQGFVNIYLTPQDKIAIKAELMQEEEVLHFLDQMACNGYKVSTSYSPSGGFFSVTLYGNHVENPNAGWAMTLRHSDLLTAYTALSFAHEHKSDLGDWVGKEESKDELDW